MEIYDISTKTFKPMRDKGFYYEKYMNITKQLFGERVAEFLGLDHVKHSLVRGAYQRDKNKHFYYLISKSYINPGEQRITGEEILKAYKKNLSSGSTEGIKDASFYFSFLLENSLENIWNSLESFIPNNKNKYEDIENIMTSLAHRYVFCLVVADSDFHELNWEIIFKEGRYYLSPIYDLNMCIDFKEFFPFFYTGLIDVEASNYSSGTNNQVRFAQNFLSVSSSEFQKYFEDMLEKLDPEAFNNLVDEFVLDYSELLNSHLEFSAYNIKTEYAEYHQNLTAAVNPPDKKR